MLISITNDHLEQQKITNIWHRQAILFAVAATNAGVGDVHLATGRTMDGVGRAVLHAVRMLTMPAGGGYMQVVVGRAGFAVQA